MRFVQSALTQMGSSSNSENENLSHHVSMEYVMGLPWRPGAKTDKNIVQVPNSNLRPSHNLSKTVV